MIQPLSLSVGELATRWNITPRQVLQHAQGLGVPLYFPFEGLAFEVGDEWHRANGDWQVRKDHDALERSIDAAERQLQRRARGQLSSSDALTSDEAIELRRLVEINKRECSDLATLLLQRETARNRHDHRGLMRATPSTLWDIDTLGSAPFPHKAFHPSGPIKVVTIADGRGHDGKQIWDGRLMALEPGTGRTQYFKQRLTIDDLCALLAEVKAIEAWMQSKLPAAQQPAPPPRPLQSGPAQEAAILAKLAELGFDPQAVPLPAKRGGRSPAKQPVRAALRFSEDVMNKAWQRLRKDGKIKDASR